MGTPVRKTVQLNPKTHALVCRIAAERGMKITAALHLLASAWTQLSPNEQDDIARRAIKAQARKAVAA